MWNWITGGTVEKGMDLIDDAFYTDQEEAQDEQKKREWKLKLLQAYQPFKVAQRRLALLYSVPYVSFASYGLAINDLERVAMANDVFGIPCSIILGFYFMGGAGEGMIRASLKKD